MPSHRTTWQMEKQEGKVWECGWGMRMISIFWTLNRAAWGKKLDLQGESKSVGFERNVFLP